MEKLKSVATSEASRRSPELYRLSREHTVYLGKTAIELCNLGINDPLTHLHDYIKRGEASLKGIEEDIISDVAERLRETPFINYVDFKFTGKDFVSVKDNVSMDSMTKNNLKIFKEELINNPALITECDRAEVEAQEVEKLANWFKNAPIGAYLIFESLPIGNQKIAIPRIYRKSSDTKIEGCFVSLYSPSVDQFNKLHELLEVNVPISRTEIEILQNNYEYYNPMVTQMKSFVDNYVQTYDDLLELQDNKQRSYGLETDKKSVKQNGIQKVRSQPKLTSEYIKTVKTLAYSGGIATPELIQINNSLDTGYKLMPRQEISIDIIRKILNKVILGITSAIDKGDVELLGKLEESYSGSDTNFDTISYFAEQATARGEAYSSNGCPEFGRTQTDEKSAMENGFRTDPDINLNSNNNLPKNFGKPQIGVCRIPNCLTRGDIWWWPDKTLVGGCSVCLCCHKLFEQGKSPEVIYNNQKLNETKKAKKAAKIKSTKKLKEAQLRAEDNAKNRSLN